MTANDMKCPIDNSGLKKLEGYGFGCQQCSGVLYSKYELPLSLEEIKHKFKGEKDSLLNADRVHAVGWKSTDHYDAVCPHDGGNMKLVNYGYNSNQLILKCQKCESVWLKINQLDQLASYLQVDPSIAAMGATLSATDAERIDLITNPRLNPSLGYHAGRNGLARFILVRFLLGRLGILRKFKHGFKALTFIEKIFVIVALLFIAVWFIAPGVIVQPFYETFLQIVDYARTAEKPAGLAIALGIIAFLKLTPFILLIFLYKFVRRIDNKRTIKAIGAEEAF